MKQRMKNGALEKASRFFVRKTSLGVVMEIKKRHWTAIGLLIFFPAFS
jgi:hypothetical protein